MRLLLLAALCSASSICHAADPPQRNWSAVELVGTASDYWFDRNWQTYYWREDFSFVLTDADGKKWRIISREPTPAYTFRMGTTFIDLAVDWKKQPKVKVVAVKAVDRLPEEFYHFDLKQPNLATALLVYVETQPNVWKEWYVNNWFHEWGKDADAKVHSYYADKDRPYDIYGFARGQVAPFDAKSQKIVDANKTNPSLMFHGRIHSTKKNAFGYEIELIDLLGRNVQTGGHVMLHGDAKTIPLLDSRPPAKK